MTRALAVVAGVLAACALAGPARADGDPASDYLLGQQVFLGFNTKVPKEKQQELVDLARAVNEAGYTIRTALIWSSYDLGAVTPLWRKPRSYAKFLAAELQFVYHGRLLIVMPNGFGIYRVGHPVESEQAVLSTIPIDQGSTGLVDAAETALQKLAAASGVEVASPKAAGGSSHRSVLIVLAAIAGLAVAVLLRLALRRPR